MRYDGILFERIKCSKFKKAFELPILFSFKARKVSDSELRAFSFLPPGIVDILEGKRVIVLEPFNGGRFNIVKAYVTDVGKESCTVVLEEEVSKDRRLFERFSFCPEEVGEFHVQDGDKRARGAFIIDMSLKGVKLLIRGLRQGDIGRGAVLTLTQDKKVLIVKVLWEEETLDGLLIGCEIVKANFNVMKFIMDNYVKHVKEVLAQNV